MPMEKVTFEFPDPDRDTSKDIKMKDDGSAEIVIDGRRDPFENVPDKDDKPAAKKQKAEEADQMCQQECGVICHGCGECE